MCPAATPDEFGDASWANAGVATITTKVSVSRSCFFMSVLYQPPLKNAIRKARTIFPATARSWLASGARSGTYGIQSQAADRRFWHPFHLHFAGKSVDAFTRFRAFNTFRFGSPFG